MSNRALKIQLWKENPNCYYCGKPTILTNLPKARLPLNAATIEHLISRYHAHRWVKKKKGQRRKVLACYECNHRRSVQETLGLSRAEVLKRSKGFSLSPRGKPKIIKPVENVREALDKLNTFDKVTLC
jgi:5-methylcytosine-specific restriction endonuclease McrA